MELFKNHLPANARLYCRSPDSSENPYLALLALADRFIVTGDSVSMMIEVARLGKPLKIFALPYQKGIGPRLQQLLGAWLHGEKPGSWTDSLLIGLGKLLYRLGLVRYSRDLTAVHQLLYEKQLAVPLGENFISGDGSRRTNFNTWSRVSGGCCNPVDRTPCQPCNIAPQTGAHPMPCT